MIVFDRFHCTQISCYHDNLTIQVVQCHFWPIISQQSIQVTSRLDCSCSVVWWSLCLSSSTAFMALKVSASSLKDSTRQELESWVCVQVYGWKIHIVMIYGHTFPLWLFTNLTGKIWVHNHIIFVTLSNQTQMSETNVNQRIQQCRQCRVTNTYSFCVSFLIEEFTRCKLNKLND